jgi:hypothetical protein
LSLGLCTNAGRLTKLQAAHVFSFPERRNAKRRDKRSTIGSIVREDPEDKAVSVLFLKKTELTLAAHDTGSTLVHIDGKVSAKRNRDETCRKGRSRIGQ